MDLVGSYGARNKRISQAGACVLVWLDPADTRWLELLRVIREQFGLGPTPDSDE
jgi:hypothetical protein